MQSQGGPGNDIADVLSYDPPAVKQARLYFSSISTSGIMHHASCIMHSACDRRKTGEARMGQKPPLKFNAKLRTKAHNKQFSFFWTFKIKQKW